MNNLKREPGPFEKTVAEAVRKARKARGWSPERLADLAGLSHKSIYNLESLETRPRLDTLEKVSAALGGHPLALFEPMMSTLATNAEQQRLLLYAREILADPLHTEPAQALTLVIEALWIQTQAKK